MRKSRFLCFDSMESRVVPASLNSWVNIVQASQFDPELRTEVINAEIDGSASQDAQWYMDESGELKVSFPPIVPPQKVEPPVISL